jgi:hypothetical protein
MGAFQSILINVITSPVVIGFCYQFRNVPLVQRTKWFYVFIISLIVWALMLDRAGVSTGPEQQSIWPSVLAGAVLISSLTFMRIKG